MSDSLTLDTAKAQVSRLAGLRGFPVANASVAGDVMRTLRNLCGGGRKYRGKMLTCDEQCRLLVDTVMDRCEGWRGPAQIRDVFYDVFPNYPQYDANGRID